MAGLTALFASLSIVDCLRSVALIVAFLATAFADKKGDGSVWLLADQIINFAFGVGITIFPGTLLGYQVTTTVDPIHQFLVQVVGLSMLGCGVIWYASSRDRGSAAAWALSRTISSAVLAHVMIHQQFMRADSEKIMKKQHQSFAILGAVLLTLGNALCAFRTLGTAVSRNPIQNWNRRNVALLVFLAMVSVNCFVQYGMPELMLEQLTDKYKPDTVMAYLTRVCVAFVLSYLFYGFAAVTSLSQKEGTAVMLAGLCLYGLYCPLLVYYQNKYHFFQNRSEYSLLGFATGLSVVCVAGTWEWFMG